MVSNDTLGIMPSDVKQFPPGAKLAKGVHPRLEALLTRHLSSEWSQPLHSPSVRAFEALEEVIQGRRNRIVLDSGCGTGESTG